MLSKSWCEFDPNCLLSSVFQTNAQYHAQKRYGHSRLELMSMGSLTESSIMQCDDVWRTFEALSLELWLIGSEIDMRAVRDHKWIFIVVWIAPCVKRRQAHFATSNFDKGPPTLRKRWISRTHLPNKTSPQNHCKRATLPAELLLYRNTVTEKEMTKAERYLTYLGQ